MRTNRYINSLVVLVATALLVLVSCNEDEEKAVPATVSLSEEVISLIAGTEQTLTATVTPAGSNIEWFSNKPHIATVTEGVVKAIEEGKAKIVAKSGNTTAICEVIVTNEAIRVTGVTLNKTELELKEGGMDRLLANLEPYEATDRRVTWSSSNANIVSIQPNGTLTAHALGESVITVTTIDGNYTATCTVAVVGTIELLAPSNNTNARLHPIDTEKKIAFSWREVEGIDKYIFKISATDRFTDDDVVYSFETTENGLDVLEYTLNEAIKRIEGNSVPVYWAIFSGTEGIKVLPESRRLNLIPDRREYLRLSTGSETGMQIQKMAGEYHYSITANGQANVNTVGLTKDIATDSGTVSFQYTSNKALPSLTVRFKKADGTISGLISKEIVQSTDLREMRLEQAELPEGWGKVDDYIQLDFGNVSDYRIQLNAIHLQKGVYVPEILLVESSNDDVEVIAHEENYFKFKVLKRDPVLMLTPFTKDLPAKAVLVSFEYKSDKIADHCQIFLLPLKADMGYPNTWGPAVPMNNTNQWKEHTVDITDTRAGNLWWGKAGPSFRIDPGQDATIGMTMEIRNIQIKMKD